MSALHFYSLFIIPCLTKNMLFVYFQSNLNCIQISLSFEIQFPNPIESFPVFRKSLYCCTGQSFIYLAVPDNSVGLCFFLEERSTGTSNWSLLINANTHHCYSAVIPVLKINTQQILHSILKTNRLFCTCKSSVLYFIALIASIWASPLHYN